MTAARRWYLLVPVLVAVGWLLTPHPVPLYDGLGFPDEPYRYVVLPPGEQPAASPSGLRGRVRITGGVNDYIDASTDEFGPQLTAHLPEGAVAAPGAHTLTITGDPAAPDAAAPGTSIAGNIYRIAVTSDGARPAFTRTGAAEIFLRAPKVGDVLPYCAYRDRPGTPWRPLPTTRQGTDVFHAPMDAPGDYALVLAGAGRQPGASDARRTRAVAPSTGSQGGNRTTALLLGGTVVLLAAVTAVIRVRSHRRGSALADPGPPSP